MGVVAIVAMKLTKIKTEFGLKNVKSYVIGIVIALGLTLVMGLIPIWCGTSLIGGHSDFVLWEFIFNLFYLLLIIGPVEELIFRVYIQETIEVYFNKMNKNSITVLVHFRSYYLQLICFHFHHYHHQHIRNCR